MDDLIQLVRAYQKTAELDERGRLADAIFSRIEPELRRYVESKIRPQFADDVLQETLKATVISLPTFSGQTSDDFMRWCRGIARHKIHDQYQDNAKGSERFQALPPEEIAELIGLSVAATPLATGERLDLDYAMKLLAESKPECGEYLWKRIAFNFSLVEIAEELELDYDTTRMRVKRCLDTVRELVA